MEKLFPGANLSFNNLGDRVEPPIFLSPSDSLVRFAWHDKPAPEMMSA